MHHYHQLQEKLDSHPVGAPRSEEFLEILKILFEPSEVELAILLEFKLQKVGDIARKVGLSRDEMLRKLEVMADRGVILAKRIEGEPAYALLPNYPGLFEYPVMKGLDEAKRQRLAQLWHAYWMKDMAAELASATPPWNRVIPAESALPAEVEILPFEVASRMMAKSDAIAVADCPCRVLERKCEKPLDVCLAFDGAARFLSERGMAKPITLAQACDVLKRAEDAALVHTGSNNADKLLFLCNCCPCCCHFLGLITRQQAATGLAKSSYRAHLSSNACTGCGICTERCPVKAFDLQGDVALLDSEKCIGCGLCVSYCAPGALVLQKRADFKSPPATPGELVQKVTAAKEQTRAAIR
jgi:Na+-translocating ferredoxin:NAD+ oxidoreductase subunit B